MNRSTPGLTVHHQLPEFTETHAHCVSDVLENDGDFRLPLGLALGSPNFPWSCKGKLGVLLESLQGQRDLIEACVHQEIRVTIQGESGVLGFPSRRGLTPRGSLECNPEIPAFPGEEY